MTVVRSVTIPHVVWCPELGETEEDSGRTFETYDAQDAAIEWAGWHERDSADYAMSNGGERIVMVKDKLTGATVKYEVHGEVSVRYSALEQP